jgi:Ca2+-binding EF-hand superfamily protein
MMAFGDILYVIDEEMSTDISEDTGSLSTTFQTLCRDQNISVSTFGDIYRCLPIGDISHITEFVSI